MEVNAKKLLSYLKIASKGVTNNPVVPILEDFLFSANEQGNLTITSSNMKDVIVVDTDIPFSGQYCVSAKNIQKYLSAVGDQIVSIEHDGLALLIKARKTKFKEPTEDANDFPKLPVSTFTSSFELSNDDLGYFQDACTFVSTDDVRPSMTGVFLHTDSQKRVNIVSTNGHLLYRRALESVTNSELNIIIPSNSLNIATSILSGDVVVQFGKANVRMTSGNVTLVSRLIDERFPQYENVIPKENPISFQSLRSALDSSISRTLITANQTTNGIKLTLKDSELILTSEDLDNGRESADIVEVESNDEVVIGFNGKLLQTCLKVVGDLVEFKMSAGNKAALIYDKADEDVLVLIMPIMLNQYT